MALLLRALLAIGLTVVMGSGLPSARAVDVVGDDEGDAYAGSGGLILADSMPSATRVRAATCPDCEWRLRSPCSTSLDQGELVRCWQAVSGCPAGAYRVRVWFREPGQAWRDLGLMCVPPGGPVTVARVETSMREEFRRALPPSRITASPPRGVMPYLPVVFDAGQPQSVEPIELTVLGEQVRLEPRPRWLWDFGDGATLESSVPGSRYPDLTVSHAYRAGGPRTVRVTTLWQAAFHVDGLGPFEVVAPVRQQDTMRLAVGQARAVLVP